MKSTRKHELQTNELADFLGRVIEKAKPQARVIAYGAVIVALVVLILVVLPALRGGAGQGLGAQVFQEALESDQTQPLRDFLKRYPDTPQAGVARVLLADRLVSAVVRGTGEAQGTEGKAKAPNLLAEAKELYAQAGKSPSLEPLTQVCLALLTAQEGDVEKGVASLKEVVAKWPQSIAADKARVHIEELAGYKPVKFSDEPLEEEKKPEPKAGQGKEPPAEAPKAPAAGQKPAGAAPKG
jgi:hypothetical protein